MRIRENRQANDDAEPLATAIHAAYPDAYACAQRCRTLLETRLHQPINPDEISYLTLHIARMTNEG